TLIQRELLAQVRTVRTDKGTEFLNKTLHAYFAKEGIRHKTSTARTPEQNGVVERHNRTLVEVARTMLSVAKVPLDGENLDKMKEKGDACKHLTTSSMVENRTMLNELEFLYSPMFNELLNGSTLVVSKSFVVHAANAPDKCQHQNTTHSSTTTVVVAEPPLNIHITPQNTNQAPTQVPTVTAPENIIQAETNTKYAQVDNDEFINIFSTPVQERWETLSRHVDSSNMHTFHQHHPFRQRWTKDHPLEQVIGNPS
ncbi:retrovirus-related pol polyprotein from transposon TNT 1-94, partial [Tanacetum coccineum]